MNMFRLMMDRLRAAKDAPRRVEAELLEAPGDDEIRLRLCTVCRHREKVTIGKADFSECAAPQNTTLDLSTGVRVKRLKYCSTHRCDEGKSICGESGKWFTAVDFVTVETP